MTIPKERLTELKIMAGGFYQTFIGLTADPHEAMVLIEMIHLVLWMNHKTPDADTEGMLKDYAQSLLENFKANEALHRKELQ